MQESPPHHYDRGPRSHGPADAAPPARCGPPGPTGAVGPLGRATAPPARGTPLADARELRSPPAHRPQPAPRWWPWVLIVVVVALAVVVASRIDLNYYALQPGTAQSVQQFITVPRRQGPPGAATRCCSPTSRSAG